MRWGGTQRLHPHSAGSTIPHLRPTGSSSGCLPSITTRWFSSGPSDSTSRWTPCPPKLPRKWLQVYLGCIRLSPSCPFRLLHTFLLLRPVRHYPHFWISARGLGPSGTLTRLRRVLPGTHFAPLRLLARLAQISVTLMLSHRGHHPRRTRSPALPGAASPACHPDDLGESICSCLGYFHRWRRSFPSDHRVGTLILQGTRLYGIPDGAVYRFAILP